MEKITWKDIFVNIIACLLVGGVCLSLWVFFCTICWPLLLTLLLVMFVGMIGLAVIAFIGDIYKDDPEYFLNIENIEKLFKKGDKKQSEIDI